VPIDPAIVAIVAFALVGLGLGILLGRRGTEGAARARALETELEVERNARTRALEEKRAAEEALSAARGEAERYREQVVDHFYGTSEQLRALAIQYRSLYDHLASGAQALCPESVAALRERLDAPALGAPAEPAAAPQAETGAKDEERAA
jgi:uncharacterized membrane-anchored protein YhcB (DUF1043 family)